MRAQLSATTDRVAQNTPARINRKIERETEMRLAYFAEHPDQIPRRLAELDAEWDVERTLETNAAGLSLLGMTLGVARGARYFLLPLAVSAFLVQHAVQGWCPPISVLRRLGFRTAREIDRERAGLKALRGDFERVPREGDGAARAREAYLAAKAGPDFGHVTSPSVAPAP